MNRLTKFSLAAAAVFTVCSAPAFAQYSGIYGVGVVLSSTVSSVGSFNLYALTDLGDSNLNTTFTPTGGSGQGNTLGSPYINNTNDGGGNSTWADGSNPSLGTFNIANGDGLTLDGGEEVTYKGQVNYGNEANVSGADMFYSINGSSFTDAPLVFNQDDIVGSTNYTGGSDNQRWYSDSAANVNMLSGLSNGTYTLSVYFRDTNTTDGHDYVSNSSNNYNATFTVVPEPSTLMMLMSSSLFGTFYLLRRRKR